MDKKPKKAAKKATPKKPREKRLIINASFEELLNTIAKGNPPKSKK
jgi:hypothetical protein